MCDACKARPALLVVPGGRILCAECSKALVAEPSADAPDSNPGAPSGREGSTPSESTFRLDS